MFQKPTFQERNKLCKLNAVHVGEKKDACFYRYRFPRNAILYTRRVTETVFKKKKPNKSKIYEERFLRFRDEACIAPTV